MEITERYIHTHLENNICALIKQSSKLISPTSLQRVDIITSGNNNRHNTQKQRREALYQLASFNAACGDELFIIIRQCPKLEKPYAGTDSMSKTMKREPSAGEKCTENAKILTVRATRMPVYGWVNPIINTNGIITPQESIEVWNS